jgi:hypothetical protein
MAIKEFVVGPQNYFEGDYFSGDYTVSNVSKARLECDIDNIKGGIFITGEYYSDNYIDGTYYHANKIEFQLSADAMVVQEATVGLGGYTAEGYYADSYYEQRGSRFALTAELERFGAILEAEAVLSTEFTQVSNNTRVKVADSTHSAEFSQTQQIIRIVQGSCDFESLFSPSASIDGVKNTFAVLDSTSALAVVAIANRSADIALSSIVNQSLQGDRIRDYVVNTSAQTTLTAQVLRIQKSAVSLSTVVTQSVTPRRRAGLTATPSAQFTVSCTATELQGIQLTLFNTASISSTIRINARPPVLFPTRYTGFDTTFQFKFVNSSDRLTVQAMNAVHDDANILRMTSINSDIPEPYSGLPIKLASNISFTNSETKNISLVGGGTGRVAIKSGERFYFKVPNTGTSSIVDNNQYFIANANITDATTSVSVTSAPFGGGNFTTNHQAVSYYFLPNSPLTINVLGPTALGGTGTSRISLSWWSADKETVATPLNRIYNWDLYSTSFRNISASSLNTWHTCRVYASTSTWPNVVLEINGSVVSISPLYQSSLVNYAPYPTVTDANIFGTIDNLDFDTISTGTLVQASSIIQNGTYNSYPQEISSANLSTNFSLSVAPIYVQQAQADLTATATITANVEKTITFEAQLSSAFAQTASARVSYDLTVTINSNSQLTTTTSKISRDSANLTVQTALLSQPRRIQRTLAYLDSVANTTVTVDKTTDFACSMQSDTAAVVVNSRTRSASTDFAAIAIDLFSAVKIGQGLIQLDAVTAQNTVATKITDVVCDIDLAVQQLATAVKTTDISVDADVETSFEIDYDKIKESLTTLTVTSSTSIDTALSKIAGFTLQLDSEYSSDFTAVKTVSAVTALLSNSSVVFGDDVRRVRLADTTQSAEFNVQTVPVKTVNPPLAFDAIATELVVVNKIAFDPALKLTIPAEYRTLLVLEENRLLTVPEETRVNMVRKIAQ